ncbi:uncharacterized protein G2W53_028970 [Senna tora]|uniref:Uncharacterized protein n=1 Tax=Senna tora TaxID=362788 RepID=A0A834WDA4_9FABA|nr:uncharacterized protein G2W53_028970 [Senna tora]
MALQIGGLLMEMDAQNFKDLLFPFLA